MKNELIIVIGAYGSGKSEYSINLARKYKDKNESVVLVDLDVVNPYFRSRDVKEKFAQEGIEVISPEGQYKHADLPMLSPRIMGAVENLSSTVILDVGGDPMGCRTLGRYIQKINQRGYYMEMVINTKRPFTGKPEGIESMVNELETASKLKIDEFVCNTNLLRKTTPETVKNGIGIIQEAADNLNKKFEKFLVIDEIEDKFPDIIDGKRKVILEYFLKKPWEMLVMKGI